MLARCITTEDFPHLRYSSDLQGFVQSRRKSHGKFNDITRSRLTLLNPFILKCFLLEHLIVIVIEISFVYTILYYIVLAKINNNDLILLLHFIYLQYLHNYVLHLYVLHLFLLHFNYCIMLSTFITI